MRGGGRQSLFLTLCECVSVWCVCTRARDFSTVPTSPAPCRPHHCLGHFVFPSPVKEPSSRCHQVHSERPTWTESVVLPALPGSAPSRQGAAADLCPHPWATACPPSAGGGHRDRWGWNKACLPALAVSALMSAWGTGPRRPDAPPCLAQSQEGRAEALGSGVWAQSDWSGTPRGGCDACKW